ncbi:MAG TPA: RHS repeat-associated core domain-containing protein [Sedimentisphaerales bacterium]|nr:RHS repeat-associated core domain-containing protein [Sedimentisphaerales bacterium]
MRREVPTIRPCVPTARGDAEWFAQSVEYCIACPVRSRCRSGLRAGSELAEGDNDAAQSGTIGSGQETWMQTTVVGPGNVSFRYKMSSVSGDSLAFYIDTNLAASWSQGSTWPWTGNFAVPSGTHTLKWKYYKYSGSTAGSCWIDAIQWSGGVPGSGGGADWEQITYTYDPSGRRIAKDVDGVVTKYLYDGDQCIAEYACPEPAEWDGSNNLLRKYIYGPSIDEPRSASLRAGSFCMVEAAGGYAGTYYYHFDALGSVVALSDADGDTVQVYEYDVYGQVAASDPNHPNRFMFTGREFDAETGLYYYRARYYNASIGRFLQTDPVGYTSGINTYTYCGSNPVTFTDPSGCHALSSNYGWALFCNGNIEGEGRWIWVQADIAGLAQWTGYPVGAIQTTSCVIDGQPVLVYYVPAGTQLLGPGQSNPVGRFNGTMSVVDENGTAVGLPDGLAMVGPLPGGQGEPPEYTGPTPPAYGGTPGYEDGWPRPGWDELDVPWNHIMDRHGPNGSGARFPWSPSQIREAVRQVYTSSRSEWMDDNHVVKGTYRGVGVVIIVNPVEKRIVTAFPVY